MNRLSECGAFDKPQSVWSGTWCRWGGYAWSGQVAKARLIPVTLREHIERAVDELGALRVAGERIASALETLALGQSATTQRAGKSPRRRSQRAVVVPQGVEVDE